MHWHYFSLTQFSVLILGLSFHSASSAAINKCELNGAITYTDQPCPKDAIVLPYTQHTDPPNDPAAAQQRYLADKQKLKQIEQEQAREQQRLQYDAKIYAQQQKKAHDHELSCKNLDTKRKMAHLAQTDAQRKGDVQKIKKADLQTRQAENNYARNCASE